MTTIKTPLPLNGQITCEAGAVVITLTHPYAGIWRVETTAGGFPVDPWTASYGDEDTARAEARRATFAFRTHDTADKIEARREQLTIEVRDLLRLRNPGQRLADAEAELDAISTLHDAAARRALAAEFDVRYAA